MQPMDVSQINIKIEVVNCELLFSRVKLLKAREQFEGLSKQLANISLTGNAATIEGPKHIIVPSHPLLSQREVKILFRVVQYKNLKGQETQLLRLEPIALFAGFYNVPYFLDYIKITFFRSTLWVQSVGFMVN